MRWGGSLSRRWQLGELPHPSMRIFDLGVSLPRQDRGEHLRIDAAARDDAHRRTVMRPERRERRGQSQGT